MPKKEKNNLLSSVDYKGFETLKEIYLVFIVIVSFVLFVFGIKWDYIAIIVISLLVLTPEINDLLEKLYRNSILKKGISDKWRNVLKQEVNFYNQLNKKEKLLFEHKILLFFIDYELKSADFELQDNDKLLIAASAVIPVFAFDDWDYVYLQTITVFEDAFEFNHPFIEDGQLLNGLVDKNGNMYLSINAVRNGFAYEKDGKNTAIHEFIHLLDMQDGEVDGIPERILKKQYIIPWINLMDEEIERICQEKSVLGEYACTNRPEFFAEASVCFFENPRLMSIKHPELYNMLKNIFNQDMKQRKQKKHLF
jgi:Mlc titration factor MtfA (ptsG expression regulator)